MSLGGRENIKTEKGFMQIIACCSVFVYIVSAIAFEMTAETARISTLAIYALFAVGVFYVLQSVKIIANEYAIFTIFFCLYVYMRCFPIPSSESVGFRIAYLVLTCTVASLFVFWMSSKYSDMISYAMVAYIIGSLILSLRIVFAYGGVDAMIEFASSDGEYRIGKLIGNENAIGLFLANGVLCSVVFFLKKKGVVLKILTATSMLLLLTMLLLTGSRKSLAFVLLGVLFIVYLNYRKARLGKKFFVFLFVVLAILVLYNAITTLPMFSTIYERLTFLIEGFGEDQAVYDTDETRKMMIEEGLNAFYNKPFFGNGTGYSYELFGTYSHNNFVELLMNYGMFGFALYYIPILVLAVKLLKRMADKDIYISYLFTYVCIQMVLGVGWVNYYERSVQILIALAFGYLLSTSGKQNGGEQDENKKLV